MPTTCRTSSCAVPRLGARWRKLRDYPSGRLLRLCRRFPWASRGDWESPSRAGLARRFLGCLSQRERPLQLSKILQGSRIVHSENRPLWTKSNQSLQGSPQRRQSAFFGLPCLPSHPKMGCGAAAAEVQSKKGARQSLCCVTRTIPPCRTAGVAMSRNLRLGVCASRLSDEPISTLSRLDAPTLVRMPTITPARWCQKGLKKKRPSDFLAPTSLAASCGTRRYVEGHLTGRGPRGLLMSSTAAQDLLLTGTRRRSRRRGRRVGASGISWPLYPLAPPLCKHGAAEDTHLEHCRAVVSTRTATATGRWRGQEPPGRIMVA